MLLLLCGLPPSEPEQLEEAPDTVFDRMVFSFDLVGASLTLYSNERPLVSYFLSFKPLGRF